MFKSDWNHTKQSNAHCLIDIQDMAEARATFQQTKPAKLLSDSVQYKIVVFFMFITDVLKKKVINFPQITII